MASIFKRHRGSPNGIWQGAWVDAYGVRKMRSTRTTIYESALRIVAKWEGDAALRREGVIDLVAETIAAKKNLSAKAAIMDFDAELRAAGSPGEADVAYARLCGVFAAANISRLGDIQLGAIITALAQIKAHGCPGMKRRCPASNGTLQRYAATLRRFARWLCCRELLPRDPLANLKYAGKAERVFRRRMLLPDEFEWLRRTLVPGDDLARARLLLYTTAIQTGYRAGELAALFPRDCALAAREPYIRLDGADTKNGKPALQYIKPGLAATLAEFLRTVPPQRPLWWRLFHSPKAPTRLWAESLREDLALSRFKWKVCGGTEDSDFLRPVNHAGERLDFHSLRHSCGAWLCLGGINVKVIQAVMRHHSIGMTMDTYGHLLPGATAAAVAAFPAQMEMSALPAPDDPNEDEWGTI